MPGADLHQSAVDQIERIVLEVIVLGHVAGVVAGGIAQRFVELQWRQVTRRAFDVGQLGDALLKSNIDDIDILTAAAVESRNNFAG